MELKAHSIAGRVPQAYETITLGRDYVAVRVDSKADPGFWVSVLLDRETVVEILRQIDAYREDEDEARDCGWCPLAQPKEPCRACRAVAQNEVKQ